MKVNQNILGFRLLYSKNADEVIQMSERYIKQEPYVGDNGIYVPVDGHANMYKCVLTKKMFVEAYNKWIKPTYDAYIPNHDNDDADCWCD